MNIKILASILVALLTGSAIALQATLNGRAGAVIGPVRTGLIVNALGGSMAILIILFLFVMTRFGALNATAVPGDSVKAFYSTLPLTGLAGFLGILIIVGISFALQAVGVTAGLSAVILAQLLLGLVIDSLGAGSTGIIAADPRRILGVIVMAIGVYLLVPKV